MQNIKPLKAQITHVVFVSYPDPESSTLSTSMMPVAVVSVVIFVWYRSWMS